MHATTVFAVFAILLGIGGSAQAQSFPAKPLKIVVPFPPGGGADIMARVLAESMASSLGQPVVVDNRPGAGAVIGYEAVARAAPDGYTMLVVYPSFVINPLLRRDLSYDPVKDFKAVGQAISLPMAIAVHPAVPAKTLQELISLARTKPGDLVYGSPGAGTNNHLFAEMLKLAAKVDIVHAPYKGGGTHVMAAVGGHIPIVVANLPEIAPHAAAGKLRALAVSTAQRAETLPDVPTLREAGFPELEATNWSGLMVPVNTPPSAIARLHAEMARALRSSEVQDKLRAQSMVPALTTPEQFMDLLRSESARYARVIKEAGIKLD